MSEKKQGIYIRLLQDLLKHENMSICHEAFFSEDVIRDILELLKAEPEQKKGKWIWDEDGANRGIGAWTCSKCERKPNTWWEIDEKVNPLMCSGSSFCGNCGADMREGEEDEN